MSRGLRIGELARRAGCPVETIRYYEREGVLPEPARSEGNYRLYGKSHVERLLFIRRCRSLDMSLAETRKLLGFHDAPDEICLGVDALLDNHIGHVADRISELQALQKQLQKLRGRCRKVRTVKDCGILKSLGNGEEAEIC
jgi:Cd(II)/Pb(II)-responsive transcriptional regulator